jgi:glycolate oxidase FAD binding subunit
MTPVPSAEASAGRVLEPTSVQEVADILRAASAEGTPVTPSGGRTRRVVESGIVLCTSRITGVEIYEPADLTITAAAGTTLGSLTGVVGEHAQWIPCDPPRAPSRTLGGLVAGGFGGPLWSGYGAPRDHVLGVTLVTGAGTILRLGGRVMKNVAGFDLVRLVVGSRGSLGVVVSACIRVFPTPAVDRLLVLEGDVSSLLEAARAVTTAPLVPASAVLTRLAAGGPASLVVRLHGSAETVASDQATIAERAGEEFDAFEGAEALPLLERTRDACSDDQLLLHLSVLPSRLPELLAEGEDGAFAADVMAGRVRMAPHDSGVEAVRRLMTRARSLQGSARIEGGSPELSALATAPGELAGLADRLRASFDPAGILRTGGAA